jgi:HNH endonuclease
MHISWTGNRCLLCLEEAPLSKEHLIPEALGGTLTCTFLCTHCNCTLGVSFEAAARTDPSIRIAIRNLQAQMPELAKKLSENQPVLVQGLGGQERGKIRRGELRIKSRSVGDGSLIQPTDHARKSVETILRKSGIGAIPLAEALRKFDVTPDNHKITLVSGLEVVKWSIEQIDLDLSDSRLMSPLVPLKIGFEFLACHLGTIIYDEAQQLREVRTALREMVEDDPCFEVERLNAAEYQPFHGICFEGNAPYARVLIRLFGWLAFRVHFRGLAVSGPRFVYTQSLATGSEDLRVLES